ncbi:methionine adenosyltransferase [Ruminococcus flavefaciens]|uniref:methionine adenosyltransferase n=1 Tax=Ruminococcus flavefaciens TaxID=1265 RepID=UPI0026ECB6B3|nr:methionine adenosyltransferase [Ruminococcus flavefaciens]
MRIITSEQVSAGHPDKICDQIADAIVTDCLQHDRDSRVAIECLLKNRNLVIAGELTSTHDPDYRKLVGEVFDRINNGGADNDDAGLDYKLDFSVDELNIEILVERQSSDIALGVDNGGAGDQGMCYGYATNETPELLPIPFVVATQFLKLLKSYPTRMLKADAKAQVSFDYDSGRITTFLCSVQHVREVEVDEFREIVEKLMVRTATAYGLNTDFVKLVNPTGRFVIGSSFADCGVTGRKLACDTYGGIGHIGGGAMSGKDPSKVDRSGAYAARRIARDIVNAGYADKAEVQIAYAIGVAEPVSVYVETFGTEHQDKEFITQYVRENYDLTPRGIINGLGLLDVDYNTVSAYGHFGKQGLPWEK